VSVLQLRNWRGADRAGRPAGRAVNCGAKRAITDRRTEEEAVPVPRRLAFLRIRSGIALSPREVWRQRHPGRVLGLAASARQQDQWHPGCETAAGCPGVEGAQARQKGVLLVAGEGKGCGPIAA